MKLFVAALVMLFVFSCGSYKKTEATTETDSKENVLPPNTASNKYSKKRQKGSGS